VYSRVARNAASRVKAPYDAFKKRKDRGQAPGYGKRRTAISNPNIGGISY